MNSSDIAKIAGVSRSTVSRVINNYSNVPPQTREKVLKVIEQYGYKPNAAARNLTGKKTQTIGLFVFDETRNAHESLLINDMYYGPFVNTVIDECAKQGYYILSGIARSVDDLQKAASIYCERRIDAAILVGLNDQSPIVGQLLDLGCFVGVIDHAIDYSDNERYFVVNIENKFSAYKATKYLLDLGHRNIKMIKGNMKKVSGVERVEGFKLALSEAGIAVNDEMFYDGMFVEEDGYKAVKQWIADDSLPSAIFAANDLMAIGALKACKEAGLSVPDDISIIGFDDILLSRYMDPPLTTVHVPLVHMSKMLINNVLEAIDKNTVDHPRQTFIGEIVERSSCKKVN